MDDGAGHCGHCELFARLVWLGGAAGFIEQRPEAEWAAPPCELCELCSWASPLHLACLHDPAAALCLVRRRPHDIGHSPSAHIVALIRKPRGPAAPLDPDTALPVLEILLAMSEPGGLDSVVPQLARSGLRAGAAPLAARLLAEPGLSLKAAWPYPPPEEVAEDWGHHDLARLIADERAARARWRPARAAWVGATVASGLYRTKPPLAK